MNSRERVAGALDFEEMDRPPLFATFVPEIEAEIRRKLDIDDLDAGAALGNDLVKSCVGLEKSFYGGPEPEYVDAWGITWRYQKNQFGCFTEIKNHPLAGEKSRLDRYSIPDPHEESQYDDFRRMKAEYGESKWLIGSSQISIFEAAWYLRGLEQFMIDLAVDPDYCHALMDKVMEFPLVASRRFISLGADMVWFGDDVSMQRGMLISLDMWRTYLKPRYAILFEECRKLDPGVKIAYHSCGACEAILDDMIEIGLDVLNPLQPAAIDPFAMKKRYGKRLALFGGLCVQHLLPHGSRSEVRAAVDRLKKECGSGGGYILAPAHHIQADTSLENVAAFYETGLTTCSD